MKAQAKSGTMMPIRPLRHQLGWRRVVRHHQEVRRRNPFQAAMATRASVETMRFWGDS